MLTATVLGLAALLVPMSAMVYAATSLAEASSLTIVQEIPGGSEAEQVIPPARLTPAGPTQKP